MLPIFIRSVSDFQSVVRLGTTPESLVLEFKQKIDDWNPPDKDPRRQERRREAQKETCRDIAQFANTLGGCLLVGVRERLDPVRGVKVADSIEPVKEVEVLRQWIEQAIINYLVPSTFTHDIVSISLPDSSVLAINVPANRHLVSLWDGDSNAIEYLRRTNHGKAWMNPDEMERHIMDGSRATKLAIVEARGRCRSDRVEIAGGLWRRSGPSTRPPQRWNPRGPIMFGQIGEFWFELQMPVDKGGNFLVTIPYGLVKEAWLGASGVVTLLLTVRVIVGDTEITLEPYD